MNNELIVKRKENFINDKRRIAYLASVYTRIYRRQSILIEGDYGVGKTRFLKLIRPKKLFFRWADVRQWEAEAS